MADEKAMKRALREIRDRRLTALTAQLRREIALELLERDGNVDAAGVAAEFEARWIQPTDEQLAGHAAQKTTAAVAFARIGLDNRFEDLERLNGKVAKYERLLEDAQTAVVSAKADLAVAEVQVEEAEKLAAYAAGLGDPSLAPESVGHSAKAESASVGVETGSEK